MANSVDYVISFLGDVGNKATVEYKWGDKASKKTKFFQVALREWFPNAMIIMLATEDSRLEGERLLNEAVEGIEWVTIPDGKCEHEFFKIYREVSNKLPPDSQVVLDITHGYRSLPMLGLLSLGYLRIAKRVSLEHVLYGAKENAADAEVPVFDLAPFMNMLDWANATDRFIDTGDARKLAEALREYPIPLADENADVLSQLANTVEEISNALFMNNPFEAGPLAKRAVGILGDLDIDNGHPIYLLRDRLKEQMEPMAFDANADTDKRIVEALFYIIYWYIAHNHHERAAALAREWVFLFAKLNAAIPIRDKTFKKKDMPSGLQYHFEALKAIRNDLAHMNMDVIRQGNNATKPSVARKKLNDIYEKLLELAREEGLSVPQPLPSANL
jgi:CRISPR-associated DxTHG motif protein